MIRLFRPDAPEVLTPAFVDEGTARFKADGSAVWSVPEIKDALARFSGGKCSYCELSLGEGSTYLEVEHFYPKKPHDDRVLEWTNLLPACRRCNGRKGSWDVAKPGQMMVDPVSMSPSVHIRFDEAYRPVGLTAEGETSITEIGLDDIQRLGVMRYKLGEVFKRKLEDLQTSYEGVTAATSSRSRRAVVRKVKRAVEKCGRDQPFSAVMSTVLKRSAAYSALKAAMIVAGDWDDDLIACDAVALESSLA